MTALLSIDALSLVFRTRHGTVKALQDVSLSVERGEILGVVGESGSGKSVMAYTVMGLQDPAARIEGGRIEFGGTDMLGATQTQLGAIRGRELSMIFQSPRTALNPIRKVGHQIEDVLRQHATVRSEDLERQARPLVDLRIRMRGEDWGSIQDRERAARRGRGPPHATDRDRHRERAERSLGLRREHGVGAVGQANDRAGRGRAVPPGDRRGEVRRNRLRVRVEEQRDCAVERPGSGLRRTWLKRGRERRIGHVGRSLCVG